VEHELWGHWPAMVRAARPVVGSLDDAQDCASEALAQFIERRPPDVDNLEAFLVTVARRRAVDHVRARTRARAREDRAARELTVEVPDVADEVAGRAEATWVAHEASRLLQPRAYSLLQMVAEGLPVPEIAARLGIQAHAVEARIMRARRTLRAVVARGLAGFGLGLAGVRRWASPAGASTAAVAAALVIALLDDSTGLAVAPAPRAPAVVHPVVAADLEPGRAGPVRVLVRSRQAHIPSGPSVLPPQGSVTTPAGSVALELHDDGNRSRGPVERLLTCLDNLRVGVGYQGCESPSDR
jgi:RNA polymerase sigma factor (sigma-70 family)